MTEVQLKAYLHDARTIYTIWVPTSGYNFLSFFILVKQMQLKCYSEYKIYLSLQGMTEKTITTSILSLISICIYQQKISYVLGNVLWS